MSLVSTDDTPPIGVGMEVYFRSHVYNAPFAPYYDGYKGHKFVVKEIEDGHVRLEGPVLVKGWVHVQDLKRA